MIRVWVPPVVFAALLMGQAPPAGILAQEGPPPLIVREVGIQGNRRIQDALILGRVQTTVGVPVVTARVAEDVRAPGPHRRSQSQVRGLLTHTSVGGIFQAEEPG